jgi:uncharacterized protein (TIGR01370 family)
MYIRFSFISFCLAVMGLHCTPAISDRAAPFRERIHTVKNFAVQFSGEYNLKVFGRYDMVIIDPDHSRNAEADSLAKQHVLPIAYVNIGEAEDYRWYYSEIKPAWVLGKNPNWERHFYIDVNNEEWQQLILERIMPRIYRSKYAGVFLDMIDIASPELFPATRGGVIKLIARIRAAFPDKIILLNNGVFLADQVSENIDGICVESVFSTYNFDTKKYFVRAQAESESRASELQGIQKRLNTRMFVIDYALPEDTAAQTLVRTRSFERGFVPFVSTIELNVIHPN